MKHPDRTDLSMNDLSLNDFRMGARLSARISHHISNCPFTSPPCFAPAHRPLCIAFMHRTAAMSHRVMRQEPHLFHKPVICCQFDLEFTAEKRDRPF
jgi:hypothetical protein